MDNKNIWFINLVSIRKELFGKNPCVMFVPDQIKHKLSHQAYDVPLCMSGTVLIHGDIALYQFLAKYRRAAMEHTIPVEMPEDPAFGLIFVSQILLFLHKVLEGLGKATGKINFIFHAARLISIEDNTGTPDIFIQHLMEMVVFGKRLVRSS